MPVSRGEVGVVLFNHGEQDLEVAVGDRVAQLVLEKICMAPIVLVENLDETERGAGGFGSTGVSSGENENINANNAGSQNASEAPVQKKSKVESAPAVSEAPPATATN